MKTIEITYKDSKGKKRPIVIEGKIDGKGMLIAKITNDVKAVYRACYDPQSGISSCYAIDTTTGLVEKCKGHRFKGHCYHTDALKLSYSAFVVVVVIIPVQEVVEAVYTIEMAIEDAIDELNVNIYDLIGDPRKETASADSCIICGNRCKSREGYAYCSRCTEG